MKQTLLLTLTLCGLLALAGRGVQAAQAPTRLQYEGHAAYRLTDGITEAVVVPVIGRVMRYGLVGGRNWLWNAPPPSAPPAAGDWNNWGGDKLWVAPQSQWATWIGKVWPPDTAWDGAPQQAVVLPNGHLRMRGPVSAASGIGLSSEFWFAPNGDFQVRRTMYKKSGPAVLASLWGVSQIIAAEAVYLPTNPASPYKNNFHWIYLPKASTGVQPMSPSLLKVVPAVNGSYKLGVDAPLSAIAAVQDSTVFVEWADKAGGDYPDGAYGAGFPVELYDSGGPDGHYVELEMLSPLCLLRAGGAWNYTMHWSLHSLPAGDEAAEIQKLLPSAH